MAPDDITLVRFEFECELAVEPGSERDRTLHDAYERFRSVAISIQHPVFGPDPVTADVLVTGQTVTHRFMPPGLDISYRIEGSLRLHG